MMNDREGVRGQPPTGGTRWQQKVQTRTDLINAAFELLSGQALDGLSIRELTAKVGITPAAFYRHFADVDELSLALVDAAIDSLLHAVRDTLSVLTPDNPPAVLSTLGIALQHQAREHQYLMSFIVRERFSGRSVARRAIQDGLRMVVLEVAAEIRPRTRLTDWTWDDAQVLAELMVQTGIRYVERLMSTAPGSREESDATESFFKQTFIIAYGADAFGPIISAGGRIPGAEFDPIAVLPRSIESDDGQE